MKLDAFLADAAAAAPSAAGATSVGNPTDGDSAQGILATAIGAYWFYQMYRELHAVLASAGIVPDVGTLTQLRDAINARIDTKIAAIDFPDGVALANQAEHLRANPPADKAATPLGVKGMIDALIDGAPGTLDTLNELAAALNDNANAYDALLALINARPTQAAADLRYARPDVVLAADIDLTAFTLSTHALGASMDDFRWIALLHKSFEPYTRVPRAQITEIVPAATLAAWSVDSVADTAQLYAVTAATGALATRGNAQALGAGSPTGAGMALVNGALLGWVLNNTNNSARLYAINTVDGTLTARGNARSLGGSVSYGGAGVAWTGTELLGCVVRNAGDNVQMYAIDPATGALTPRGSNRSLGSGNGSSGLALAWNGAELLGWVINDGNDEAQLYAIDPATGLFTARGASRSLGSAVYSGAGMAWTGTELLGWVTNNNNDTAQLYTIDPATGALVARGNAQALGSGASASAALERWSDQTGGVQAGSVLLGRSGSEALKMLSPSSMHIEQVVGLR